MRALFLNILNLTINASWLIAAVILARLLLKKAPKWISCLLWGLVALRLLCPVSLTSALSLLPSAKVVPGNIEMVQDPHIDSGVKIIDNAVNPVIERSFSPDVTSSVNPMQVVVSVATFIWLAGVAVMLIYALISFILLKRKVRASVTLGDKLMECDEVDSPFILGIIHPVIYVPSGVNEKTLELVIAHEEAHLKRHDHWWKPLGFALLAVYWFNPLCWAAYILLCRDIEAACDERVIRDKDSEYMAVYSQALLDCSVKRRIISACPLAFGETGVKERVKGVLNYKKPAFWVIIIAVIICVVVTVCFMTNPKRRYYDITVKIPAGSEIDTVWYSDEEVSPKGSTLKLDTGDFYRGVLILQAVDGSEDIVEQTAQLQSNTPVTFQVKPGVWYRIGLRMGLNTGENDISLKVRVNNAEVRIASGSGDASQIQSSTDKSSIEIVRPEVNLAASEGADLTEILYADKDRIVFSGYYGLFVYSKEKKAITNAIDLESIGCNYTQGDNACIKAVSADGNTVYLHPMGDTDMFVYDIKSDRLSRERYDLEGYNLHAISMEESYNPGDCDTWSLDGLAYYTVLHHGETIGDLAYADVRLEIDSETVQWYPLFTSDSNQLTANEITAYEALENLGVEYTYNGGLYVVEDDMAFMYKKTLTGRSPNAAHDLMYIVLTNDPDITFEDVDRSLYSSNFADHQSGNILLGIHVIDENGNPIENNYNPIGLSIGVKDITPTGCTLVFSQHDGNVTGELQTGAFYEIQAVDGNGEWKDILPDKERAWNDIAFILHNEGVTEQTISWKSVYGSLENGHYRIYKKVMDFRDTGDYSEYDVYAEFDVGSSTSSAESVTNWMDITLPSDYSISQFYDDIGWMGGSLILPRSYEVTERNDSTPIEWQYSGIISRIPADNTGVTYTNGIPDLQSNLPHDNHSDYEENLEILGLERSNTQWSVIFRAANHDLYTAPEMSTIEQNGIDMDKIELTSDYWEFWFVKEGEDTYYILTLSAKEFTKAEAIDIALGVSIK